MIKLLRLFSVRTSIVITLLIFTIIPAIIISMLCYSFSTNYIQQQYMENYIEYTFEAINKNVENTLSQINITAVALMNDDILCRTIINNNDISAATMEKISKVIEREEYISRITIVANNGKVYNIDPYNQNHVLPDDAFMDSLSRTKMTFYDKIENLNGKNYIIFGKECHSIKLNKIYGKMIVYIDEEAFHSAYRDFVIKDSIFFITDNNMIISHDDSEQIGKIPYIASEKNKQYGDYIYDSYKMGLDITSSQFEAHVFLSADDWFALTNKINRYIFVLLIILALSAVIVAVIIAKRTVKNLAGLKMGIESFIDGNSNVQIALNTHNEIYNLEYDFNTLVHTINDLIEKNNYEKEKQKEAELLALQSQINPHFIYNALDSICWISKENGQDKIEQISQALASFFRIGLSRGKTMITVREEIEHVKSYIAIKQIHYPDKFDVEFDIDEELYDCLIMKIVIQPLVENSIKHGFDNIDYKGRIIIRGHKTGDDILFEVYDNGVGISKDIIGEAIPSKGYGVVNVNERLSLYYGEGYGITFDLSCEQGTRAYVKVKYLSA